MVISEMEHHANIVPWHMLRAQTGIELRWIGVDQSGYLDLSDLDRLLDGAKLLSVTAMSNVLGTSTRSLSSQSGLTMPVRSWLWMPANTYPTCPPTCRRSG